MVKRIVMIAAMVVMLAGATNQRVAAQDPILPIEPYTCEDCMHDTALWLGNKCEYAWSHCSPCYYVVDFWCSPAHALRIKIH